MWNTKTELIRANALIFTGVSGLHFLSLFDLPYSYYIILRWLTFVAAIAVLTITYKIESNTNVNFISVSFFIMGVLWNPIFPIYLSKDVWNVLNFIVTMFSAFLAYSSFKLTKEL